MPTMWSPPCGISSRLNRNPLRPVPRREVSRETRLAQSFAASRRSRPQAWAFLVTGHIRSRARQFHDRDRGLRPAGADAALVLWRALHLSAPAAAYGLFTPVRGGLSGEPGPR